MACKIGAGQVARLIDHVDEILADQALDRILEHERNLRAQMLAQRHVVGQEGLDVDVVAGSRGPLAQRCPAGIAALPIGVIGGCSVLVDVVVFGVERAFRIGYRLVEIDEVRLARRRRLLGLIELGRLGGSRRSGASRPSSASRSGLRSSSCSTYCVSSMFDN